MASFKMRPTVAGIKARNSGGAPLDDAATQFNQRMQNLDNLLARYQSNLANLPENVRGEIDAALVEVRKAASDIEDIKQKLVSGVMDRNADADSTAAILIRNTEAVKLAADMLSKRQRGDVDFGDISARNTIILSSLGVNATKSTNDLERTSRSAILSVIDLINWGTTSIDVVSFMRETAFNIMAGIAVEGTEKPESSLTFGTTTLNVGVIAHWITVSNQVLADMPALAAYIETKMAYGIRFKLEYYVVNGHIPTGGDPKHFSGLLEAGNSLTIVADVDDTPIDVLSKAKYKAAASFVMPETIVLNPEDWGNIERLKGTDGHYLFGSPGAAVQAVLWGLPVTFAASMPLGKYWVGNLSVGFDGYVREEVNVRLSTENKDNFVKNLVTILAEMRACGSVVIPDANVSGTLPVAP